MKTTIKLAFRLNYIKNGYVFKSLLFNPGLKKGCLGEAGFFSVCAIIIVVIYNKNTRISDRNPKNLELL